MNVYDVRLLDKSPACGLNWPEPLPEVTRYLGVSMPFLHFYEVSLIGLEQRSDVVRALHAEAKSESWVECNGRVGHELRNRNSPSSITLLPKLVERVPVMLFAGDQDFICNYMGIEALIAGMEWSGEKGLGVSVLRC